MISVSACATAGQTRIQMHLIAASTPPPQPNPEGSTSSVCCAQIRSHSRALRSIGRSLLAKRVQNVQNLIFSNANVPASRPQSDASLSLFFSYHFLERACWNTHSSPGLATAAQPGVCSTLRDRLCNHCAYVPFQKRGKSNTTKHRYRREAKILFLQKAGLHVQFSQQQTLKKKIDFILGISNCMGGGAHCCSPGGKSERLKMELLWDLWEDL